MQLGTPCQVFFKSFSRAANACHNKRARLRTRTQCADLACPTGASPHGALMSASTTPLGGGPGPAPPGLFSPPGRGGDDDDGDNDNDDFSPLLDLLQRFPDLVSPGYSPGTECTVWVGKYFDCHIN